MKLQHFRNELPDEESLEQMGPEVTDAIVELLEMAAYADDRLTRQELDTLRRELELMPRARSLEQEPMSQEEAFFERGESLRADVGDALIERVQRQASRIERDVDQQAALRLVAILCVGDGLDVEEIEFYHHLVDAFDYDFKAAEKILRAARAARQEAPAQGRVPAQRAASA